MTVLQVFVSTPLVFFEIRPLQHHQRLPQGANLRWNEVGESIVRSQVSKTIFKAVSKAPQTYSLGGEQLRGSKPEMEKFESRHIY